MYRKYFVFILLLVNGECANILGIFHIPSYSHHTVGESILKVLAENGHKVTFVSPFSLKSSVQNLTHIHLKEVYKYTKGPEYSNYIHFQNGSISERVFSYTINVFSNILKLSLENREVQKLIQSDERVDLVILDCQFSQPFLPIAYYNDAHVIAVSTSSSSILTDRLAGNPNFPVISPTTSTTLLQRVEIISLNIIGQLVLEYFFQTLQEKIAYEYFPKAPSLEQISKNVSLVFMNSHSSIEYSRPYVPNMVHIGGIHIQKSSKVDQELTRHLNNAKEGFIYFSLGSNMKSSDLPKEKFNQIINAFARLNLKVFWKFESDDDIQNLPKNINISKWFSQIDVLAHPNIKAFITHAGLLSIMEAVYYGVPIIGIPLAFDQPINVDKSVHDGYGILADLENLTEESLFKAITEILNNSTYSENVKRRSNMFRNQQYNPSDTIVYWVEYMLRYQGAKHLQVQAINIRWYQYYLVDIFAFVALIIFIIFFISVKLIKFFIANLNNLRNRKYEKLN